MYIHLSNMRIKSAYPNFVVILMLSNIVSKFQAHYCILLSKIIAAIHIDTIPKRLIPHSTRFGKEDKNLTFR